jgi:hypothetical protein
MPEFDANDIFCGNFVDATSRLGEIEQFSEYMGLYLKNEAKYFREEAHVDLEIEYLPLFAETFPPILYSSLIISAAIVTELEMRGYADTLRKARGLELGLNDFSGSMLERFRAYAGKLTQLPIDWSRARWEDVVGLFEIRNCLVHSGGNLREFGRANVVRAFARRQAHLTARPTRCNSMKRRPTWFSR